MWCLSCISSVLPGVGQGPAKRVFGWHRLCRCPDKRDAGSLPKEGNPYWAPIRLCDSIFVSRLLEKFAPTRRKFNPQGLTLVLFPKSPHRAQQAAQVRFPSACPCHSINFRKEKFFRWGLFFLSVLTIVIVDGSLFSLVSSYRYVTGGEGPP